jgi:hypothetical protein
MKIFDFKKKKKMKKLTGMVESANIFDQAAVSLFTLGGHFFSISFFYNRMKYEKKKKLFFFQIFLLGGRIFKPAVTSRDL